MSYLTPDAIEAANERRYEDLDIPQWGGTVRLQTLMGDERDAWEGSLLAADGKTRIFTGARARLAVRVLVDGEGNRLYKDSDAPRVGRMDAKALDLIFDKAAEMNGLDDTQMERMEKNLDETHGGDSPTD